VDGNPFFVIHSKEARHEIWKPAYLVNPSIGQAKDDTEFLLNQFKIEHKPIKPLLPPDVKIRPGYEEGKTPLVGNVQEVHGEVLVFHDGEKSAFRLKQDLPLYQGDTLVAMTRSRANIKLHDGSAFTLAPSSKMVIDKSVYNAEKEERSSFLKLMFGRARFFVAKLRGRTDYRVGTPTAVCGVRGSDFALAVFPYEKRSSWVQELFASLNPVPPAHAQDPSALLATVICTGENTTITFSGLIGPLQGLGPIQVSWAPAGVAAAGPIQITLGAAMGALNAVGPSLAAISMPPGSISVQD